MVSPASSSLTALESFLSLSEWCPEHWKRGALLFPLSSLLALLVGDLDRVRGSLPATEVAVNTELAMWVVATFYTWETDTEV